MEKSFVLEITLISAQGLKQPSGHLRRMQTYALAWVESSVKLRTCVDRVGNENPTWNDKFLFKVSSDFLSSHTSAVSVEIFAVGVLRDSLLGTVRFLVSNFVPSGSGSPSPLDGVLRTPLFNAVQIRRPSGRFRGVLNICAMVLKSSDMPAMKDVSAIGFRDLIGKNQSRPPTPFRGMKKSHSAIPLSEAENTYTFPDTEESDDCDSTTSSSSSASTSTALRELNGIVREFEGIKINRLRSSSDGGKMLLCGLVPSSPSPSPSPSQ